MQDTLYPIMHQTQLESVKLSAESYQRLIDNSTVLEQDTRAVKVLQLADQTILKLFRAKSLFSSATLRPYPHRFIKNASLLKSRGIPTLEPLALFAIPSIKHTAVQYFPLTGKTLRQIVTENSFNQLLAANLGEFIAVLHQKGFYFRSLHLGNIILTPENTLGLIDVADMAFKNRSLLVNERIRNFKHLFRYIDDKRALGSENLHELIQGYLDNALLGSAKSSAVEHKLDILSQIES